MARGRSGTSLRDGRGAGAAVGKDPVQPPAGDDLTELGTRPSLPAYLRSLWRYHDFLWTLALMQLRARNGSTALGELWTVLSPLLLGGAFYLVFGIILGARLDVDNYVTFLLVGVFTFTFTQRCVTGGATAVVSNVNIIRSVNLPRATFPTGAALTETLAHLPALVILATVAVVTGEDASVSWLLLLPAACLQLAFGLGLALLAARLTFQLPDVRNLLPFAMRVWLYFSGVFFTAERVPDGLARTVFELNPMHVFIELNRSVLLGPAAGAGEWGAAAAWGLGTLVVGLLFFWQRENSYGSR